jgi:hypothetical protein
VNTALSENFVSGIGLLPFTSTSYGGLSKYMCKCGISRPPYPLPPFRTQMLTVQSRFHAGYYNNLVHWGLTECELEEKVVRQLTDRQFVSEPSYVQWILLSLTDDVWPWRRGEGTIIRSDLTEETYRPCRKRKSLSLQLFLSTGRYLLRVQFVTNLK